MVRRTDDAAPHPLVPVGTGVRLPQVTCSSATSTTALVPGVGWVAPALSVDGVLVDGHQLIREELLGLEPHLIVVFGGSAAVSDGVFTELEGIPRS